MKPMYHVSLSVLVAAFPHSLCRASTATCARSQSHLCTAVSPPSLPLLWPRAWGGHTTLSWPSLEPRKLFKVETVPPYWGWFWLLQCLLSPYEVFNSFLAFPSLEGEHVPTLKDRKAQDSRSHQLGAFSCTPSHSLPYLCTQYPRSQ